VTCDKIEYLIPAYLEGDLSGEELSRVDSHLGECRLCREELEQFHLLESALVERREEVPAVSHTIRGVLARTARSWKVLERLVSVPALVTFLFLVTGCLLYIYRGSIGSLFARQIPLMETFTRAAEQIVGSLVQVTGGDIWALSIIYGGLTLFFLLVMGISVQNVLRNNSA
jgi:predicted anti-sigma-YlaC factor YlaD